MAETKDKKKEAHPRTFRGTVVSNKAKDTILVEVLRYVLHPKYKKYIRRRKKFAAHDEGNKKQVGENVMIEECRPISKTKHFRVLQNDAT